MSARRAAFAAAAMLLAGAAVAAPFDGVPLDDGEGGATAFPGALGYGRYATGWRGGEVVPVTNLADSGPGSLRACAGAKGRKTGGARVCVFDVGGTIEVASTIFVASRTYLAGQTSPGGIQLKLGTGSTTPLVVRRARDVLVRHIASRPGSSARPSANIDGVTIEDAERVYLDHLSIAFGTDENVNIHANAAKPDVPPTRDITIANSIVAYGLDHANHPKGGHSKGALICSGSAGRARCGRITLIANLFAHNRDRNPDVKATAIGPVEILGNLFYDPKSQFGEFYDLLGDTRIAYRGNVALAGPSTRARPRPAAVEGFRWTPGHAFELNVADNRTGTPETCRSNRAGPVVDANARPFVVSLPWEGSGALAFVATDPATRVPAEAGSRAAMTPSGLDALDTRVLSNLTNCKGRVIDAAAEAGGWPVLRTRAADSDRDGDGMPDDWERRHGLDPDDPADNWTKPAGASFSHLELYLEARSRRLPRD